MDPHLRLLLRINALAFHEDGNVVFVRLGEYIIGHGNDLQCSNRETGLLERFTLRTREQVFALVEMPTWEGPLAWRRKQQSQ